MAVGEAFTLTAGLAGTPPPDLEVDGQPILIPGPPDPVPMVVHVAGFGFSFPGGIRRELAVPLGDVTAASVTFDVVAEHVRGAVTRVLEVSYEYAGNLCGRAWREVLVAEQVLQPVSPPLVGGNGVTLPPLEFTPHLTVEIRSRQGRGELEWIFHARDDDLVGPTEKVTTELEDGSAREFALRLMATFPADSGSPLLGNAVRGAGEMITARMPPEMWPLVEQVWWRAREAGETPSLLLVTSEPWVPWELAWLGDQYVDPTLLPAADQVRSLGALWRVGRWVPPQVRTPRGGDRPPMPPPTDVDPTAMAVVIGDYASDTNVRPLPYALEEGQALCLRYRGYGLVADEDGIARLLANELSRGGAPFRPTVVHIAAHGQFNPAAPQFNGIILSNGGRRLDELIVRGSKVTDENKPFVFLNACEVGTAGRLLSEYGGLAGAFVSEGCTGFLAPLWNVDDGIAREVAEEFYREAIDNRVPVAEVLRTIRARFDMGSPASSTPLAYVFYGHPALTMRQAVGP